MGKSLKRSSSSVQAAGERVFLGMGSNLGERQQFLSEGLKILEDSGIVPLRLSSLYDTDPVGYLEQGAFLNMVVEVADAGTPRGLLASCRRAEQALGRERGRKDGPRTLDVDILLWGQRVHRESGLVIPHPRLQERRFVLVPLEEIAPEVLHPVLKATVRELLKRCADSSGVRRSPARLALERGDPSRYNPAASRGNQP
jgi:2-amino-4-hydroxy-6-hydroxymethyldihydropteridine diphosphokinase